MNKLVGKWGPLVKIHYYNHGKKYGEAIGLLTAHLPSLKKFNKPCVCDFHTEALSGWSKDPRQTKVGTKDSKHSKHSKAYQPPHHWGHKPRQRPNQR